GHKYASDVKRPGMLYGKVLRPPAFGDTLASVDTKEAEALPGVTVVRDGNFVGVAAPSEHRAEQALVLVRAEWKHTPQPSGKDLFDLLKKGQPAANGPKQDAPAKAPDTGEHRLRATYTVAYIAHVPLEPRAAV